MGETFRLFCAALRSALILAFPDMTTPFLVATYTSSYDVGAVPLQLDDDGREHPVQFISRFLKRFQTRSLGWHSPLRRSAHSYS